MRRDSGEDALSTCHASLHKRGLRNICLDSWLVRRARGRRDDDEGEDEKAGDRQDKIFPDIYL